MKPIPILLYHSIVEQASREYLPFTLPPSMFEVHITHLRESGYTLLTVSDVVTHIKNETLPPNPVIITFDDGLRDFVDNAMPILSANDAPATLYIVAGFVGKTSLWLQTESKRPMMTWQHVREVASAGIEIGAHSMTHREMDVLAPQVMREEVSQSKAVIEDHLGQAVLSFAYPHGYHDDRVIGAVRSAGYDSACAVKNVYSHSEDNVFALARLTVTRDVDLATLVNWLDETNKPMATNGQKFQTQLWRQYRRLRFRLRQ